MAQLHQRALAALAPYASVVAFTLALAGLVALSCGREPPAATTTTTTATTRTLTLGAYSAPREAYAELLPRFAREWQQKTGEALKIEESYLGSGAQARAIVAGFEADVAALSLAPDIDKLRAAGLVHGDAQVVSRSLVVIGVRPGNPKGIRSFADLARADVDVLTPDVKMSGGAMWNVAALAGSVEVDQREAFLASVLARVSVFDRGARESMLTFESGAGDAVITYESEIAEARRAGRAVEEVIPPSTLVIECPAAVVDEYAAKHGNLDVARALVAFLVTPESQRVFAAHGYQSEGGGRPPQTIAELGGWPKLAVDVFAPGALYDRALSRARP